jgi:hypothetical protein
MKLEDSCVVFLTLKCCKYLLLLLLSLFIIFSGSAAQRGLWPPVALQPSAGYGYYFTNLTVFSTATTYVAHPTMNGPANVL